MTPIEAAAHFVSATTRYLSPYNPIATEEDIVAAAIELSLVGHDAAWGDLCVETRSHLKEVWREVVRQNKDAENALTVESAIAQIQYLSQWLADNV